ncbi:MAG: ribosomal RNA small subunit methyltransferase A [Candidatus Eisenbacteria bacterium]|nr:ribosomal RNA small subunit methyltransferase A [Candidatus Eisenbacteria bacterium]
MTAVTEKRWLQQHGVRPRRRWGQHFLIRPTVAARLLERWALPSGTRLLEIGPGAGALTLPLLAAGCRVLAVERDGRLCDLLRARVAAQAPGAHLELIEADILECDPGAPPLALPRRGATPLIGNLPYAVTSPILEWTVRHRRQFRWASFMVQREYAERLQAAPGTRDYGSLTVWIGYHFSVARELRVGPEQFWPRPRVDSEVVRLRPHRRPPVRVPSPAALQRVLRAAFGQRRKMMVGALASGLRLPRERILEALERARIDPRQRAETCDLRRFAALTRALHGADAFPGVR